jgi:hypothetical protein
MSAQDDAKKLVDDFEKRTSTFWTTLSRADIAADLRVRIDNPDKINQGETSLCGPADFVRDVAEDNPVEYARAVIELYETGRTRIGTLDLKPCHDLRAHALPVHHQIADGDWIILATLRDDDNWWFDYQSQSNDLAAITMPHTMEKWLKAGGYTDIISDTNIIACKDLPNALRANKLYSKGYKVTLFINAWMLDADHMCDASTFPDHWVALTTAMSIHSINVSNPGALTEDKNSTVEFEVYTWGDHKSVPVGSKPMTDYCFLCNYYGFIACRR